LHRKYGRKHTVTELCCRVATAGVVARAVRLLAAQLGLLRADAANAHLRMLSASLAGDAGIRWTTELNFC
jgi:hypothetical protein